MKLMREHVVSNLNVIITFYKAMFNHLYQQIYRRILYYHHGEISIFIDPIRNRKKHWYNFGNTLDMSESYLAKHTNRIDWSIICRNHTVPESFLEDHIHAIDWFELDRNPYVSELFFRYHIQFLKYRTLINVSEEFCERFASRYQLTICFESNLNISESFVEKYIDIINWSTLHKNINIGYSFYRRCNHYRSMIPLHKYSAFLDKATDQYLDKVNWHNICMIDGMPVSFLEKHLDRVAWGVLSRNDTIPEEFFEKHIDKLSWGYIDMNNNISRSFFEKHQHEVKWGYIYYNYNALLFSPLNRDKDKCVPHKYILNNWNRLLTRYNKYLHNI
jgi:hypothetical protein